MTRPTRKRKIQIWKKDNFTCVYCGFEMGNELHKQITVDHVKPLSLGGSNSSDNLVTACRRCNQSRGKNLEYVKYK